MQQLIQQKLVVNTELLNKMYLDNEIVDKIKDDEQLFNLTLKQL